MLAGFVALTAHAEPRLDHLSTFVWDRPEPYFGGWSGIDVSSDGTAFFAIGDGAQTYEGTLERTDGKITGLVQRPIGALVDVDGVRIHQKKNPQLGDSEGLSTLGAGYAISFERDHRIVLYGLSELPVRIDLPKEVSAGAINRGIEALATDLEGRLVAIPEALPNGTRAFPIWRQNGEGWDVVYELAKEQGFAPVGADFSDDGRLFVLERAFRGIGFQNRLRVVSLTERTDQVIWTSYLREFDNLEGMTVWTDPQGQLRVIMISDDNYRWFQRTEIVEFRLTE